MKRARTIAVASTLIALAAVAVGYGTGTAGQPAPTAEPTGSDQATLMAAHQGGTLKLLAKAAGGTIDRTSTTRSSTGSSTRPRTTDCSDSRRRAATGRSRSSRTSRPRCPARPTAVGLGLHAPQGDQVLQRQDGDDGDVVASLQRIFKVSSPTSGTFYAGIVGAKACIAMPATCTLKGGVSANASAGTVTINLTAPDPEFKYKLAVPHASIVPASSPPKDSGTKLIPGPAVHVLVVQPEPAADDGSQPLLQARSKAAQPAGYPDRITYSFGLTVEAQITAIQNGQADWTLEALPATGSVSSGGSTRSRCTSTR